MYKQQKVSIKVLAICLILAMFAGSGIIAMASRPEPELIPSFSAGGTDTIFNTEYYDVEELWPLEARMAAEPLPWHPLTVDESESGVFEQEPAGFHPGGPPDASADEEARQEFEEAWQEIDRLLAEEQTAAIMPHESVTAIEGTIRELLAAEDTAAFTTDETAPYGTPAVFDDWMGNKWGPFWFKYPHRTVGKLYITGGGWCSASVLSPKEYWNGYGIIVTAAHCVYDASAGSWLPGWTFVPADRKGVAPYGLFPWQWARVLTDWQSTGATRYDVALIGLQRNSVNQKVTNYTGWLGYAWGGGSTKHLISSGYPSNLANGRWSHICAAESFSGGTDVLGKGCNMTFGSSGGPWIFRYEYWLSGANNYVHSVVSGGTPGTNTFYGPHFTSNNIVVLCDAIGGCY